MLGCVLASGVVRAAEVSFETQKLQKAAEEA
jgi:hypothetical protein